MGYLQFISNLIDTFMRGASFAIGQGEPYLAIININAVNSVLPPDDIDPETHEINSKGYRVDLSKILPKITARNSHDKTYLTESLDADVNQWIAINTALSKVAEAVSRYAHDNKAQFGMM